VDGTRDAVRITLTNTAKQADLDLVSDAQAASFNARAKGYVTVANLNPHLLGEGLAVELDVATAPYGNTVANLVAGLVTAGYTNSVAEAAGVYDLRVVIPRAYLTNSPGYFLWDFTDTSTGATNATVSGLRFRTGRSAPAQ
jgi:hypothetical protein